MSNLIAFFEHQNVINHKQKLDTRLNTKFKDESGFNLNEYYVTQETYLRFVNVYIIGNHFYILKTNIDKPKSSTSLQLHSILSSLSFAA